MSISIVICIIVLTACIGCDYCRLVVIILYMLNLIHGSEAVEIIDCDRVCV